MTHNVEGPGPDKAAQAGFYSAMPLGPFGGNLSLAGILLSGFFKLVREMLEKAQQGTAQFRKLQDVEREVAKLMKLLNSIPAGGKIPKDFSAQLNKILGKGKNDPGVLGKLIAQVQDGPWDQGTTSTRATLEAQLGGIRKSLGSGNVIARLEHLLKDLKALQNFIENFRSSSDKDFFDKDKGANLYKFINLLGAVYKDVQWLDAFTEEMGKVIKVPPALEQLKTRINAFWKGLMGIDAGQRWNPTLPWGWNFNGHSHDYWSGTLGSLWNKLYPNPKSATQMDLARFDMMCDALLWENGKFGWFTYEGSHVVDSTLAIFSEFGAVEKAVSGIDKSSIEKISYGDYLKMVHMILQEEAKDPNWAEKHPQLAEMTSGYNEAMAELEKLLNTAGTSQPDVNAYIKGASDQANQLLQTLRHFLTMFNRLIYSDIDKT